MKNSIFCSVVSIVLVMGFGLLSWGHGVLIESFPSHGAILQESPSVISLRFNDALETSITRVTLIDLINQSRALDVTNSSTLEQVVVTVPPLIPGVYNVNYQVLAADGHVTEGAIRFTILTH